MIAKKLSTKSQLMNLAEGKGKLIAGSKRIGEFVLDILYPKQCLGCGKEGHYICKECEKFTTENNLVCPVCGNSSFTGHRHESCGTKYSIDGLVSTWDYEGIIKKAIKELPGHAVKQKALLEYLLENPDQRLTTTELAEKVDTSLSPIRGLKEKELINYCLVGFPRLWGFDDVFIFPCPPIVIMPHIYRYLVMLLI